MSTSNYTPEEIQKLASIIKSPLLWAEAVLKDPESGNPFKANYIERLILSSKSRRNVIRCHRRGGKMQPLYSSVYTPNGVVEMGSLKLGDIVSTPNGETGKVSGIYPHGKKEIYRLTLDDGTFVDAGDDHLWEVYTSLDWKGSRRKKRFGNKVITTKEIMNNLTYSYSNRVGFNYKLNPIKPIKYTEVKLPIDPYLLGVLLGDGHLKSRRIFSNDSEVMEKIISNTGFDIVKHNANPNRVGTYYIKSKDIKEYLISLNLIDCKSHTKFIPKIYLYSDINSRIELLRGLMDTDGSSDKNRKGQSEYCSVSKELAYNVAELARSLGCKVTIKESKAGYSKNGIRVETGLRYKLTIRNPHELEIFNLNRKKCGGLDERYLRRTIVKVEKLGFTSMQCIEIDHPDHLYITDNCTPTHNTVSVSVISLWGAATHKYYEILILAPDEDKVAEIFETIRDYIDATPSLGSSIEEDSKSPNRIKFKNGSTIKGKTTGASSNRKAMGVRGKGAHIVIIDEAAYLKEADWTAISSIITGDMYKGDVLAYVASTPSEDQGRYYSLCTDKDLGWNEIHVPITENPDIPEEKIQEIKAFHTEREWITEDLAEFLDIGENVFKNSDIDYAMRDYSYEEAEKRVNNGNIKCMGVDWDKFQAGVNIAIVELISGTNTLRVIYREEIPRSEYTLTNGVQKVIDLNEIFQPSFIYVDRGFGETNLELLRKYGEQNPSSKISERVMGFNFNENVEIVDPLTKKKVKKQFKAMMLNNLMKAFEEKYFEFSRKDKVFEKQLRSYKILGMGANTIRTTRKNEHIIDCVGLACYAVASNFKNPFKWEPAKVSVSLPAPKFVKSEATSRKEREIFSNMKSPFTDRSLKGFMSRGFLSNKEPSRSKF